MKNGIVVLIVCSCFVVGKVCAQTKGGKMDSVRWLVGKWKMEAKNGALFEEWQVVDDSTLQGKSYKVRTSGDTLMLESVQFTSRNGVMHYTPTAFGQNDDKPVAFKVVSSKKSEFVAENLAHDFPQRIIYKLKSPKRLDARIEGMVNSKLTSRDFPYQKQ